MGGKIKIFCPDCKDYTAKVIRWKHRYGLLRGVKYRENIGCCKCQVCCGEWEAVIDITFFKKNS